VKPRGLGGGSQAFEPPADETSALVVHNVPQPTMMGGLAELLQGPAFDLAHALPTEPSAPRGHPPERFGKPCIPAFRRSRTRGGMGALHGPVGRPSHWEAKFCRL